MVKFRNDAFVVGISWKPEIRSASNNVFNIKKYFIFWLGFWEFSIPYKTIKLKAGN